MKRLGKNKQGLFAFRIEQALEKAQGVQDSAVESHENAMAPLSSPTTNLDMYGFARSDRRDLKVSANHVLESLDKPEPLGIAHPPVNGVEMGIKGRGG